MVTSACYSIGLLYVFHLFGILTFWYGISQELSSWIVPKIVLKFTTVLIFVVITCVLTYFINNNPAYVGIFIARGLNVDYLDYEGAIDIGATVLVTVSAAMAMGHIWLLVLLIGCYKDVRKKEIELLVEKAMKKEKAKFEKRPIAGREGGLYTTFI
ncbi:unnamed protein product [Strongylus vulgaris]|uniref:Uncharacterized protein n=1 Tax=Strongylus vulgaris TaxID=40348 RepID=A0A3P7K1J8_STRVU|nr:unnamed protein product [Strongylus vulgaris]